MLFVIDLSKVINSLNEILDNTLAAAQLVQGAYSATQQVESLQSRRRDEIAQRLLSGK
jgi:hypothetical protein